MASAQICPIVGTTTTVLPPNHPAYDATKPGLVCPVTNASTDHHHNLTSHPTSSTINNTSSSAMSAQACPALKNANKGTSLTDATCPVVGPVSAYLPVDHPSVDEVDKDAVCPVTKASLGHHEGRVQTHPKVGKGVCPVAHKSLDA